MKSQLISATFAILLASLVFSFLVPEREKEQEQLFGSGVLNSVSQQGSVKVTYEYTTPYELQLQKFEIIKEDIKKRPGNYGIYVRNLSTNDEFIYREREKFYGASLLKVPIALATYNLIEEEKIDLKDKVKYKTEDFEDGTGSIATSDFGTSFTVAELLNRLLKESDNVAQTMLTRIVGEGEISKAFRNFSPLAENSNFYSDNITSPYETAVIFENMYKLDTKGSNAIINIMMDTFFDDRISLGLNKNTKFSHKIGSYGDDGVWHDCGIILEEKPTIVCLMSSGTTFDDFTDVAQLIGGFVESINL